MDFTDCPCTGKTLSRLVRPAMLTLLAREPLHGYELRKRCEGLALFHGQPPDAAGLYRALREMEDEGLVLGAWDTPGRGPAKRRYAITLTGQACLSRWKATLTAYRDAIAQLLDMAGTARDPSAFTPEAGPFRTAPERPAIPEPHREP